MELARANVRTIGFDVDVRKVAELAAGRSYIPDVPSEHVAEAVNTGLLTPTTDAASLAEADVIDICVPTPLRKTRTRTSPMSSRRSRRRRRCAARAADHPRVDDLSRTTDEVVKPALEAQGLTAGEDFHLAFSPERVDPGNPTYHTRNIPKVVGGIDRASTEAAAAFYRQVVQTVVPVSSTRRPRW